MGIDTGPFSLSSHTVGELVRLGGEKWSVTTGEACEAREEEPLFPLVGGAVRIRRRTTGKQLVFGDPATEVHGVYKESVFGHILVRKGRATFCDKCGRWAIDRLSLGLLRKCTGIVDTVAGAYRVRRERLRLGRRPLTNVPL